MEAKIRESSSVPHYVVHGTIHTFMEKQENETRTREERRIGKFRFNINIPGSTPWVPIKGNGFKQLDEDLENQEKRLDESYRRVKVVHKTDIHRMPLTMI